MYSDPKKAGSALAILDGDQLRELSTPYSSYGSLSVGQTGLKLFHTTHSLSVGQTGLDPPKPCIAPRGWRPCTCLCCEQAAARHSWRC